MISTFRCYHRTRRTAGIGTARRITIETAMVLVSRWLPEAVANTMRPIVSGTVMACYSAAARTNEMVGEAVERVESIITRGGQVEEEGSGGTESAA